MINPNDRAFPQPIALCADNTTPQSAVGYKDELGGLTIRAELAARAMQGILSNVTIIKGIIREIPRKERTDANCRIHISKASVELADALIAELNKQP